MQFKYKVIEVTESVKNFLVKKVEDNNNEEIVKVDEEEVVRGDTIQDELYQPPDDDLGIGGTVSTVGAGGEDVSDDSETDNEEDGSSKDTGENRLKRKGEQSVPANPSIKVPRIEIETFENKLSEFGKNLLSQVEQKLSSFEETLKNSKGGADDKEDGKYKDLQSKDIDLMEKLFAITDLESSEKCLDELDIGKLDENDNEIIFYCRTCFENNPPPPNEKNIPGCFTLDIVTLTAQKLARPEHQPRVLRNLKINVKRHITTTFTHKNKVEEKERKERIDGGRKQRNKVIGLNLFRIRYSGIKQHQPRTAFEDNVLTAKLNGVDVGDINNSRFFAKDIDVALFDTMKDSLKEALGTELEASGELRPVGLLFDKMTPSKETGQVHAIIIPVPENQMDRPLLVPVCLDIPAVTGHSIAALPNYLKLS